MDYIIKDEDQLLRRVPFTDPRYIKDDGSISSFAFSPKKGEDGLSVDIEKFTTHEKSIIDKHRFRLYRIAALIPRALALECKYDPIPPENNAHALIIGNITKSISRKLAAAASKVPFPHE